MRPYLLVAASVLPGLAIGCARYAEHRAALVPHATPIPWDGQPLQSKGELSFGASNIADPVAPSAGTGDPGVEIPNTQLRGAANLRVTRNLWMGAIYERGLESGAHAVTTTQPAVDNGATTGLGAAFAYSIETRSPLRIGLAMELMNWTTPWVQYSTCINQYCGPLGYTVDSHGSDNVWQIAFALTPSYRVGRVTWFGGLTMRNHPTLDEKAIDYGQPPEVQGGPMNFIAALGASVDVGAGVRASFLLHQDLTRDPVAYGPAFAMFVAIPLGRDVPRPPPPPPANWVTPSDRQAVARSDGAR